MRIAKTLLYLVLIFFISASLCGTAMAGPPLNISKKKEKIIRKLIRIKTVKGTAAHQKKENKLRKTINEVFDFEELGERSLELHWDDLNKAQRTEFLGLLQSLIEKNYLLKIANATSYKIKFYPEVEKEDHTIIRFKIKSGKYKAAIQLRFIKKNNEYVVYDMLIDDVSLLGNYRSQFNRIIRKKGFDVLIEKMNKKLNELSDDPEGKIEKDKF